MNPDELRAAAMQRLQELQQGNIGSPAGTPRTGLAVPMSPEAGGGSATLQRTPTGEPFYAPQPDEVSLPEVEVTPGPPAVEVTGGGVAEAGGGPAVAGQSVTPELRAAAQQRLRELTEAPAAAAGVTTPGPGSILEATVKQQGIPEGADPSTFFSDYGAGAIGRIVERVSGATMGGPAEGNVGPGGTIIEGLRLAGRAVYDHDVIPSPQQVAGVFKDYLRQQGVDVKEVTDSIAAEMGAEQVDSAIMLLGMRGVAGVGTNLKGGSTIAKWTKKLSDAIIAHPVLNVTSDVLGATPGGVLGKEAGGTPGAIVGGLVGGLTASTMVGGARKIFGQAVVRPMNAVKNAMTPNVANPPPIVDRMADPGFTHTFLDAQLDGDRQVIENAMMRAVGPQTRSATGQLSGNVAAATMTPEAASKQVMSRLLRARELAEGVVSQYWSKVNTKQTVNPDYLEGPVARFKQEISGHPSQDRPDTAIAEVERMYRPLSFNPDGTAKTGRVPTVEELRQRLSLLARSTKNEFGKTMQGQEPNRELVRLNAQLASIIESAISQANPNDIALQQARAMSTEVNNLFNRTELFDLLAKNRRGMPGVRGENTVEELLKNSDALKDVLNVTRRLQTGARWKSVPGSQLTYKTAFGSNEPEIAAIKGDVENAIRSTYHQAVEEIGGNTPENAAAISRIAKQMERQTGPLTTLATQFNRVHQQLGALIQEKKMMDRSFFARYAQVDPAKAVKSIFASQNPARDAKMIRDATLRDPSGAALAGFESSIVEEFLSRGINDPGKLLGLLRSSNSPYRRLLNEALTEPKVQRLEKILDLGAQISRGDVKLAQQTWGPKFTFGLGLIGARVGSIVDRASGRSTIAIPAAFARNFREIAEKAMGTVDAAQLVREAITNPEAEKFFLSRAPNTPREMKQMARMSQRWVRRMEAVRAGATNMIDERSNDETVAPVPPAPATPATRTRNIGGNPFSELGLGAQ